MIHITKASEQRLINQGKFKIRLLPLSKAIPGSNDRGLYQLGRIDHATLEPGTLVPMHLHHNDEILSYMRKGTMVHKDSQGNIVSIDKTNLMMMNAGSGFYHEESVPNNNETVEMLQIFMRPREDELTPAVQFYHPEEAYSINRWRLIGGNERSSAPLKINNEIEVYDARIQESKIEIPDLNEKIGYLYIFGGKISIPKEHTTLEKGDAILIDQDALEIQSDKIADIILFILDKDSQYSKNGLFAR